MRAQVLKLTGECESAQAQLARALVGHDTLSQELRHAAEFTRNELESMQEEVKTLEYKLVHSQRQAQEYQSLLEDLDLSNANTAAFLQQQLGASGQTRPQPLVGEADMEALSGNSVQSKLKRNQLQVQVLVQQVQFEIDFFVAFDLTYVDLQH